MLTAKEISNANRHDRATGQRPAGHFDHDANKSTGPESLQKQGINLCPSDSQRKTTKNKISLTLNDLKARR